ncbi:aminotransferase [Streptomyces fumigatiscleroticus]|nr:aminotransferase [Streptomyces fumigatiscleroticus]
MAESAYGSRGYEEASAADKARAAHEGVLRRQSAREPAARTYARALPIVPVRARGLTIEGADGHRYLDCLSGAGTLALGHNHPVVLEAIRGVLDSGAPLHAPDLATPVKDAFVTELFGTLPAPLADHARVRFCGPAGTDAVATAVELVRAATGRSRVIAFTGTRHGTTAGRPPGPRGHHRPFGAGEEHGAEPAADWAEFLLDGPAPGAPPPAGMLVAPVLGEGGVMPAPDAWMRRIRRLTAARSVPLIADEIETGVGRTGAFWAVEHSGVTPDVMVLSKAIGGSLPLAVVIHHADLDTGESGARADGFRGNQLAMAAGTATLAHVRENRLAERAATLGTRLLARLRDLAREYPYVGEVRGRGLMLGIEMADAEGAAGASPAEDEDEDEDDGRAGAPDTGPGGKRAAASERAAAVQRECLRRGLIVGLGGPRADVVRLLPPLTITDEQAAAVLDRLADAVEAVARGHPGSAPPRGQCRPPGSRLHDHHPGARAGQRGGR